MKNYLLFVFLLHILSSCNSKPKEEIEIVTKSKKSYQRQDYADSIKFVKQVAYQDSLIKVMQWKPLNDGLSISKYGDIGFKSSYQATALETVTFYVTNFCDDAHTAFKNVIDTATFKQIGGDWGWGGYFKDKNHIYHFFGNSGGGVFSIVEEADYTTFKIIGDCYGVDKNHVYDMRFGLMDGKNPNKFKILPNSNICLAKYNGKFYNGNTELNEEEMKNADIQKAIKKLNRL